MDEVTGSVVVFALCLGAAVTALEVLAGIWFLEWLEKRDKEGGDR